MPLQEIPWGVMAILLPLAGALACFFWPRRTVPLGLVTALGVAACVVGLGWQVVGQGAQRYAVGGLGAPLGDGKKSRREECVSGATH
jgi:hypothetical protein